MKTILLVEILLASLVFNLEVSRGRPMPASLRKIAVNRNLAHKVALGLKRATAGTATGDNQSSERDAEWTTGLRTNFIPPMARVFSNSVYSGVGGNDYYDELNEDDCPPGFMTFLKTGQCVPDKCGYGTTRNRATGECEEDAEMSNVIPVMGNPLFPPMLLGIGRSSSYGGRGFPSKSGSYYKKPKILGTLAAGLG